MFSAKTSVILPTLKRKHPTAGGGPTYLDSVESSTVFDLDATIAASYTSGQTWSNLTASPADGSAQTDYDFYLGATSSATTDDPTFTGSAGSQSAYWALDGGDWWTLKSGVNTTFLKNLHKTTGGQDFWIAIAWQTPAADSAQDGLFATSSSTASASHGIGFLQTASETMRVRQTNGTSAPTKDSSVTLTGSADHIIVLSLSHGSNQVRFWADTTTKEELTYTLGTETTDADGVAAIAANSTAGAGKPASGTRIYSVAMGNSYIDNTAAAAIISHLETRHGRDYTP